MDIKKLDETFSVCSQLRPEDMVLIAADGFGSIICNRPDGEEAGQPGFAEVAAFAEQQGLEAIHVPVPGLNITPHDLEEFRAAYDKLSKPVLAYCRSGGRSTALWAALSVTT